MAIRQRYYAPIQSRSGDLYKLSVWDLDHQSESNVQTATWGWISSSDDDAKEIDTIYDSVEIVWDGDNDKVHQPIIGSTLRVTFLAETDDEMGIPKALRKDTEFRVGIKLERYNYTTEAYDPYWYGVVLPEAVRVNFSDHPTVIEITATDGLSTLRDKPYVNTDDSLYAQTTADVHRPARVQIGNCFKHLPHLALWGEQDDFFFECVDLFHESHATLDGSNAITSIESILDNTGCNQNIWYEERDVSPPFFRETEMRTTGATCYDVISNWMSTLGLRLCHTNGAFLAVSPFADRSNINSRLYKSDKRTLVDPDFQFSAAVLQDSNTALLPDELDLTSEKILEGSTKSYLHPVRGVFYKHLQGGAARLFPEVKWVAIAGDFPQTDQTANLLGQIYEISENYNVQFPLQNDDCIVPTQIALRMVGTFQHFFRPADTSDEDTAIGAQFEVKMKIKVGDKYLKQSVGLEADANLNNDSDFGTIVKTGSDITTWKPLVITDDVEWTTNSADRFSFPAFLDGSRLVPSIDNLQYDAGDGNIVEYPPGFGCTRHPDHPNKQRHNASSRNVWKQAYEVDLDFALPELPSGNISETGVEISVEVIMYKNDGTTTTTGSEVFPTNALRPDGARIIGFNLFVGDGADEGDAFYYAELDAKNGREMLLGGESLVASRVVEDYGELGAITANSLYTHKWHSENDFTFGSGQRNLAVLAEEHIRLRGVARDTYSLRFLVSSSQLALPHPLHTIKFSEGSASTFMRPFTMTHAISENVIVAEGYKTGRDTGTITAVNDAAKKNGGVSSQGAGGITGTTSEFRPRSTAGSSLPGIAPDDQTKLDGIAVGATANDTDANLKDRANHTGTQTATTISDFASAVTAVQAVVDNAAKVVPLTLNAGGTAFTSVGIEQDAIRADKLLTSTDHQLITQTQLNAIASNTVTNASHTTSIGDIEDKTDLISISAQHNLDDTKDKVGHIQIDGSNGITGLTVKAGSTPLTADEVSVSGTTNKFVTTAQKNKIDHLTVTDATNLDTHRQKVSYITATSQGITGFTVPSGGKPLTADQIDDATTGNKFTDADGVQALSHIASDADGITAITTGVGTTIDMEDLSDTVALLPDPDTDRSSQTGAKVLTIASNGAFQEVADGGAGQFLQTNGSGVLSFASAGGGWHGSTTLIKVLPTEWMGNDVGRAIVQARIEDDTANTLGVQINDASGSIFAFNEIPTGFKATHVHVYTSSAVTNGVTVKHYNTTTGATSNSTTGNTNTSIDITDLTSSTTNALVIEVSPGSTSVFTFSASITITSV